VRKTFFCIFFLVVGGLAAAQSNGLKSDELQSNGLKSSGLQTDGPWHDSMYERFTFEDFARYEPSGMEIDFTDIDYSLLNAAIFYETNRRRSQNGKPLFFHSAALERASSLHSRDMVEKGFFSHENPYDPKKRTPWLRMSIFGIEGGYVAENITEGFGIRYQSGTPVILPEGEEGEFRDYVSGEVIPPQTYRSFAESVVESWMRSPPHRANILDEQLHYLGCGAYHYKNKSFHGLDQFKVTQNFSSDLPLP
jgi:uncharacterized protein YkwD